MSIYIKLISIAICTCCLCLVRFIFNNDNRSIVKHRFMILGTFWIDVYKRQDYILIWV